MLFSVSPSYYWRDKRLDSHVIGHVPDISEQEKASVTFHNPVHPCQKVGMAQLDHSETLHLVL